MGGGVVEMRVKSAFEGPCLPCEGALTSSEDTRETLREQQNVCWQVCVSGSITLTSRRTDCQ